MCGTYHHRQVSAITLAYRPSSTAAPTCGEDDQGAGKTQRAAALPDTSRPARWSTSLIVNKHQDISFSARPGVLSTLAQISRPPR
jgi:hypothetical protein